jgi:pimeloyl-ACP methyl ester carboxylesterase
VSEWIHTVLVPGLLCSARLYERVLPEVWARGAATIADTRRDDTLGGMAERLLAAAPERFVLAGLSMGGYVALEVLRRAPERVRAVACISTSARPDTGEQTANRRAQMEMARDGSLDELVDAMFPTLVDAGAREDAGLLAIERAMAHEIGPAVFCVQQEAIIARPDSRPQLPSIACPAAVIHGAGDQVLTVDHGEELAAGIPGARRTIIPGCGHMSTLERPAEVGGALGALLDAC